MTLRHAGVPEPTHQAHLTFGAWAHEVCHLLQSVGRVRGQAMERLAAGDAPEHVLQDCRGDEPLEAFEAGDTAGEYATFLTMENPDDGDTGFLECEEL